MKVIENKGAQVYRVLPETDVEIRVLDTLLKQLHKGEKLYFKDAQLDDDGTVKSVQMYLGKQMFPVGNRQATAPNREQEIISLQDGFFIHPTDEEDRRILGRLRRTAAYCSGLVLHEVQHLGDIFALSFTGCYCAKCRATIIQPDRCEWQVCLNCAKGCEHVEAHGLIKKDGRALFGKYCQKCGLHQ